MTGMLLSRASWRLYHEAGSWNTINESAINISLVEDNLIKKRKSLSFFEFKRHVKLFGASTFADQHLSKPLKELGY